MFVSESLNDILKPKSEEDIRNYLKKELEIKKDKISIRFSLPFSIYYEEKMNELLKKYNLEKEGVEFPNMYAYGITGDLLNIFYFLNAYYGWENETCVFHMRKNIII